MSDLKILFILLVCMSAIGYDRPKQEGVTSNEAKVKLIRGMVGKIDDHLVKYKKVVKENIEGESLEGNEVDEYFENNKIRKITGDFYGETGKLFVEYYFDNDKLIFYYSKKSTYDVPIGADREIKISSTVEKRYYFNNGTIFLVKLKPAEVVPLSGFVKLSADTRNEANRLLILKSGDTD